MRFQIFHTHKNTKKGRDEPIFVLVEGAEERCQFCARLGKVRHGQVGRGGVKKEKK